MLLSFFSNHMYNSYDELHSLDLISSFFFCVKKKVIQKTNIDTICDSKEAKSLYLTFL